MIDAPTIFCDDTFCKSATCNPQSVIPDTINNTLLCLDDTIAFFVSNRNGRGRETAVKGTSLDKLTDIIIKAIKCVNPDLNVLKGKRAVVPGYYRPSKNWDIVVKQNDNIIVAIELKSLTRCMGNNFNNRVEECLGSAIDIRDYMEEHHNNNMESPFLGYLLVMSDEEQGNKIRKSNKDALDIFKNTSYLKRASIFCKRLAKKKYYNSAQLITFSKTDTQVAIDNTGFETFLSDLLEYLWKNPL